MTAVLLLLMLWLSVGSLAALALGWAYRVTHEVDELFGRYERRTPEPCRLQLIYGGKADVYDQAGEDVGGDAA